MVPQNSCCERVTLVLTGKQGVIPSDPSGNRLLARVVKKEFLRGHRKCMNRMPKKFASLPVSPVSFEAICTAATHNSSVCSDADWTWNILCL
jgi:hypothetical protein